MLTAIPLTVILEAAFRSIVMALAVWAGIRMMRVHHVLAQKLAWVLVLLAAVLMPLVMRAPFLALDRAIEIPLRSLLPAPAREAQYATGLPIAPQMHPSVLAARPRASKPLAGHREPSQPDLPPGMSISELGSGSGKLLLISNGLNAAAEPMPNLAIQSTPALETASPSSRTATANIAPPQSTLGVFRWNLLRPLAATLYSVVLALLLVRMLLALSIALRVWYRATPLSIDSLPLSLVDDLFPTGSSELTSALRIRLSPDLTSPVTIASTIFLPADYAQWPEEKLRVVLAHEQSHVRQGDFYLQLAASLYAAIFWFSPLGWWLKRKLSELGEALSDLAGLAQAQSPFTYAEILLQFAALPHKPLAGVAMARSTNLSSRIDRIVNHRRFRLAFLGGRHHAFLVAALVPAALVAVVACIRIAPAVEAAQATPAQSASQSTYQGTQSSQITQSSDTSTSNSTSESAPDSQPTSQSSSQTTSESVQTTSEGSPQATGQLSGDSSTHVTQPEPTEAPEMASPAPPPTPSIAPPEASQVAPPPPTLPPAPRSNGNGFAYLNDDDDDNSFAIINGNNSNVYTNGQHHKALEEAKKKYHSNFIWFERDGKSYVITDPAIVAQSAAMFKMDPRLELRQQDLQKMQAKLDQEMKNLKPEIDKATVLGPEFQEEMKKLNAEIAKLQTDKIQKLTDEITKEALNKTLNQEELQQLTQEKLGDLQGKIGDIQGQIGEIQGKIGERQGLLGEKQGEIGERMGELGEKMGEIGEEQGRKAEEAARKMRSILDQAVRDGKANPIGQ